VTLRMIALVCSDPYADSRVKHLKTHGMPAARSKFAIGEDADESTIKAKSGRRN
jgi:hypothetical protein